MTNSLLATKLRIPDRPHNFLPRQRLLQRLDQDILRHRLSVVAAPAGYGKTTLLADWARSTRAPVAWLSLSPDDDSSDRFLQHLLAAWLHAQPQAGQGPLGLLLAAHKPEANVVLSTLLNTAEQLSGDLVLVLDDYHLMQDPAIHDSLAFMLDRLPPQLHFALGTRTDPPLPLARLRARGQLFELGPQALSFSLEEAAGFLEHSLGLRLAAEEVERWQQQLEGWAAGLQLAALSLKQRGASSLGPAGISGRQRYVADYLSQDVVSRLSPDVRAFLLQTSILQRLSAPLCQAVTGLPGAQAMLERLERDNLFVQALDDERTWFRYHPLFAEFLRAELARTEAGSLAELHRRAAAWYADNDLPEPAFEHAIQGNDFERVVQIMEDHVMLMVWRGDFRVLQHWLDSLPDDWRPRYPLFDLIRAGVLVLANGRMDAAAATIDGVEQRLASGAEPASAWQMARVKAIRCALACIGSDLAQAEQYAGQALRDLPEHDFYFQQLIHIALGDTYRLDGRWQPAQESYLRGLAVAQASPFLYTAIAPLGALADLELRQGRLRAAASYWRQALAVIDAPGSRGSVSLPVAGWACIRLAEILYEWGELDEAWRYLRLGRERAELGGDVRAIIAGCLAAARLKLTRGDVDGAGDDLERARPLVEEAGFAEWSARFERLQLEFWLAQDRLRAAVAWSDERLAAGDSPGKPEAEAAELAMARVLVVRADAGSLERALRLLDGLLAAAEADGRTGIVIEALAVQSLARWRRGDGPGALATLERALRLAEPENYVRLFADLGLPLARLLQEARSRGVMPEYVQRLLAAFGAGVPALQAGPALPEPLTARETEVLQLLAAGLTNREIADKLVISPGTVKKHSANIYAKLGTGNRVQAVARARELDLLS
jgi:LuxR family transcriptional regulator, maltose regulon positive regulatory protein